MRAEWVLPLHGSLPPSEQARVFAAAPRGVTKIVLSTNVAEASVTINDVVVVIDSGRVKRMRYDASRRVASLQDARVSRAQAEQRRGRAGRVREGRCYHLFPSDAQLDEQAEAEVRSAALDQLVLSIKALRLRGTARQVLATLPTPPESAAVRLAIAELVAIGGLTEDDEALTPLGQLMVELPVDSRLAKLVLLGCCFGAVDETLTVAAALACPSSLFLTPFDAAEGREIAAARLQLAGDTQSDHVASLRAYRRYYALPLGVGGARAAFAAAHHLDERTLAEMRQLKRQLLETLASLRLVSTRMRELPYVEELARKLAPPAKSGSGGDGSGGGGGGGGSGEAGEVATPLLAALIGASLHPQLAYVQPPELQQQPSTTTGRRRASSSSSSSSSASASLRASFRPPELLFRDSYLRASGAATTPTSARPHPSAVGVRLSARAWASPFVAYQECVRTSQLFVRECTPVPPLAPLLFCGDALAEDVSPDGGTRLEIDGWLSVDTSERAAALVREARGAVGARWAHMLGCVGEDGGGYGGRFTGGPLLAAVLPLLEQRAVPLEPPKVRVRTYKSKDKDKTKAEREQGYQHKLAVRRKRREAKEGRHRKGR